MRRPAKGLEAHMPGPGQPAQPPHSGMCFVLCQIVTPSGAVCGFTTQGSTGCHSKTKDIRVSRLEKRGVMSWLRARLTASTGGPAIKPRMPPTATRTQRSHRKCRPAHPSRKRGKMHCAAGPRLASNSTWHREQPDSHRPNQGPLPKESKTVESMGP